MRSSINRAGACTLFSAGPEPNPTGTGIARTRPLPHRRERDHAPTRLGDAVDALPPHFFGKAYNENGMIMPLPDGSPWPPDALTALFKGLVKGLQTPGVRFHDLRHTHASEMLRNGIPLRTVSQRLGHANPTITLNVYSHVMSRDDEQAASLVEQTVGKSIRQGRKEQK